MIRPGTVRGAIAMSSRRTSTSSDSPRMPPRHSEGERNSAPEEGEAVASRDADAK